MLFNSLPFLVFLPAVLLGLWLVFHRTKTSQNAFLLAASYAFYMAWDWRFALLLAFSTLSCYAMAIRVEEASDMRVRRRWLRACIVLSLAVLGFFKYFGFFTENLAALLAVMGVHADIPTLRIILPVGISFYTFHGLSYILDVYYGRIRTHRDVVDYALFVAYFPLLVAGPIERATHLLPQLKEKRSFSYPLASSGLLLAAWGMLKKVMVADNVAPYVDTVFSDHAAHSAGAIALAAVGFAVQVYADFSGYTDIARGISRMFGIELIRNFDFPYAAKTIPEFWSRWHISLSSWLNDYVFTPIALGLRDLGRHGVFLGVMSTFLISGLWHGPAWHFVLWGGFHGLMYLPYIYSGKGLRSLTSRKRQGRTPSEYPMVALTFAIVCVGYILFRADDTHIALGMLGRVFTLAPGGIPREALAVPLFGGFLFLVEAAIGTEAVQSRWTCDSFPVRGLRQAVYLVLGLLIMLFWGSGSQGFIYFQF
jgi:alginate O-acetyltransferase complex protein AlgI